VNTSSGKVSLLELLDLGKRFLHTSISYISYFVMFLTVWYYLFSKYSAHMACTYTYNIYIYTIHTYNMTTHVPDRRCRIVPEVVLVRRWAVGVLGIWRGRVWVKGWDRGGQFTSNLRPRWTDPVTARRRVPSK
jgi:hypothetical protein